MGERNKGKIEKKEKEKSWEGGRKGIREEGKSGRKCGGRGRVVRKWRRQ